MREKRFARGSHMRGLMTFAVASAIALIMQLSSTLLLNQETFAQKQEAPNANDNRVTTTTADSTYGEGGTLTIVSDKNYKTVSQTYKDKNGVIREAHGYGGFGEGSELCFIYDANGKRIGGYFIRIAQYGVNKGSWVITDDSRDIPTKTRQEAAERANAVVEDIRKKDAIASLAPKSSTSTGPTVKGKDDKSEVQTNIDPPKLPPPENFLPQPKKEVEAVPPVDPGRKGETGAPKSCGDVADQETLLALGCLSEPAKKSAPVTRTGATPTRTRRDQAEGCLNDPVCIRDFEKSEGFRDSATTRDAPVPPYPIPGGPLSGPDRF